MVADAAITATTLESVRALHTGAIAASRVEHMEDELDARYPPQSYMMAHPIPRSHIKF